MIRNLIEAHYVVMFTSEILRVDSQCIILQSINEYTSIDHGSIYRLSIEFYSQILMLEVSFALTSNTKYFA